MYLLLNMDQDFHQNKLMSNMYNYRNKVIEKGKLLIDQGVELLDLNRIDIRGELKCGKNVIIDINCIFIGNVFLSDNVKISSNCIINNSSIARGTNIRDFSIIENTEVGKDCNIGPYARLRANNILKNNVQIGNYVEVKNSNIGSHSKISHMSFIGDSKIGSNVTIGAGTITCNHDGANINKTIIDSNAYIGSGTRLIAPLKIGKYSTIGSGSIITKDVANFKLAIARSKDQIEIDNWERPNPKNNNS